MKIPKDSWNICEKIIRRYPANVKQYQLLVEEAMTKTNSTNFSGGDKNEETIHYQSSTEAAAIKLTSEYCERIRREITAVEESYENFRPEEQAVIKERFWIDPNRNTPFLKIIDTNYSERQMRRICRRMILYVGRRIGEINTW